MFAGVGCCGCVAGAGGGLRISPHTRLPHAGFGHLLAAFEADPNLLVPRRMRGVVNNVADELTHPGAAPLLRRLTGSRLEIPEVRADDPTPPDELRYLDGLLTQLCFVDAAYFGESRRAMRPRRARTCSPGSPTSAACARRPTRNG